MSVQGNKWGELQEKISAAIEEWRQEHPEATLTEIEEAVDDRVAEMRRQMVEDLAQQGRTADLPKTIPGGTTSGPLATFGDGINILSRFDAHPQSTNPPL